MERPKRPSLNKVKDQVVVPRPDRTGWGCGHREPRGVRGPRDDLGPGLQHRHRPRSMPEPPIAVDRGAVLEHRPHLDQRVSERHVAEPQRPLQAWGWCTDEVMPRQHSNRTTRMRTDQDSRACTRGPPGAEVHSTVRFLSLGLCSVWDSGTVGKQQGWAARLAHACDKCGHMVLRLNGAACMDATR